MLVGISCTDWLYPGSIALVCLFVLFLQPIPSSTTSLSRSKAPNGRFVSHAG